MNRIRLMIAWFCFFVVTAGMLISFWFAPVSNKAHSAADVVNSGVRIERFTGN
jgi:hypothetical protein